MQWIAEDLEKMPTDEFLAFARQCERWANKHLEVLVAQELLNRVWRGEIKLELPSKEEEGA